MQAGISSIEFSDREDFGLKYSKKTAPNDDLNLSSRISELQKDGEYDFQLNYMDPPQTVKNSFRPKNNEGLLPHNLIQNLNIHETNL